MKTRNKRYTINKKWIIGNVFVATLGLAGISQLSAQQIQAAEVKTTATSRLEKYKDVIAKLLAENEAQYQATLAKIKTLPNLTAEERRDYEVFVSTIYKNNIDSIKSIGDDVDINSVEALNKKLYLDREQEIEAKNKVNNLKHREDVLKKLDKLEADAKKYLDEIKKEAGSDFSKIAIASGIETELKSLRTQISASIANSYIDSLYKQAETKLATLKQNVQDIKNSPNSPAPKLPEMTDEDLPQSNDPSVHTEMPKQDQTSSQIKSITLKGSNTITIADKSQQTLVLEIKNDKDEMVLDPGNFKIKVVGELYDLGQDRLKIEQDKTKLLVTVLDSSIYPGPYTLKLFNEKTNKEFSLNIGLKGTLPESGIYKERLDKRIALNKIGTDEKSDIDKLELLSQDKKDKAKNEITNELNKGLSAINRATTKNDVDNAFKEAKALIEKVAGSAKQENLKLKDAKRPAPKQDMPKAEQPKVETPAMPEAKKPVAPKAEKPAVPAPSMPKQDMPKAEQPKINVPINPETPMSGIVYVPMINNSPSWKVALWDKDGKFTGNYISTNSNWKVFAKKMINGKLYYRIGNQNQWIPAQYVGERMENMEEHISGIVYLPLINHDKNWMVAMLDQHGNFTGKYLKTNTNWKVFAKKIINGKLYYRLGTQNQWIPAQYAKFYK